MISLNKKMKKEVQQEPSNDNPEPKRISIRDKLLVKEVQEMNETLPATCITYFEDPNVLSEFTLIIKPDEGYWQDGEFVFDVQIKEEYNMVPPTVKCKTRIFHPNINEDGEICLSLLRLTLDEHGWAPTRKLKDVVWGLNSLFTDLLNFDDPLNVEAADLFKRDRALFQEKIHDYMRMDNNN